MRGALGLAVLAGPLVSWASAHDVLVPAQPAKGGAGLQAPASELEPVASETQAPAQLDAWALGGMFVGTIALTSAVVMLLMQRRNALRLEREVAARTRELETSLDELARTERLRSLGMLAGGIAHDLRNVLTVFTGNLSLLQQEADRSPVLERYLESTERALSRASTLARQLQSFASGGAPITAAVELEELARECAKFVFAGSGVDVRFEIADDLRHAEADASQVEQVLENLMHNARQCLPDVAVVRIRGRNLRVEADDTEPHLRAGDYVELIVADDGPGIPEEVREQVFEPFFTTRPAGSGLGLATARSILERHGGKLELVESRREDEVTCFRLVLPAAAVEEPDESEFVLDPVAALDSARVLVVDDEESIRSMLEQLLEHLGLEPVALESSREAIAAVEAALDEGRPFDYAILDLSLPGDCSGVELLELLRERDPDLTAVASSGHGDEGALVRPEEFGFDAALPKPYKLRDLTLVLRDLPRGGGRPVSSA